MSQVFCPCGCGEKFSSIGSRGRERRYFSPACSLRVNHYIGQNPFLGKKHTEETKNILSEKASVPKPWLRGENNGMYGKTGERNPNWKGGGSPERQRIYSGSEWRKLRRLVVKRDQAQCMRCGSTERPLHLHHKKSWAEFPELRLEPDNIETLCKTCHDRQHSKGGYEYGAVCE